MINKTLYSAVGCIHREAGKGDLFLHFIKKHTYIWKSLCLAGKNVDTSNPLSNSQKVMPGLEQYLRSSLRR